MVRILTIWQRGKKGEVASNNPLENKKTIRYFGQHYKPGKAVVKTEATYGKNLVLDMDLNPCSAT